MHVTPLPALSDNYMYLIVDEKTKEAGIVDPVEPSKVIAAVKAAGAVLKSVLTTHHHGDHAGGNQEISHKVPGLAIYGGDDRIKAMTQKVHHGDKFKIGELQVECLFTPCHTTGHICYYVTDSAGNKAVFTGDTMFICGCGAFFEGTADQMYKNLVVTLGSLPDDTKVYPGHEYTVENLEYAHFKAEPSNQDVAKKLEWARQQQCTAPSTIGEEKRTNPFMRVNEPTLQQHAGLKDPIQVMKFIREEYS